jgi:hypothetical protein
VQGKANRQCRVRQTQARQGKARHMGKTSQSKAHRRSTARQGT